MQTIILISIFFVLSILIGKYSHRWGLRKGLRASASNPIIAKRHKLFKKSVYWKVVDIFERKTIGMERHYALIRIDEDLTLEPIVIRWSEILPCEDKELISVGHVYELTIRKKKLFLLGGEERNLGIYINLKAA